MKVAIVWAYVTVVFTMLLWIFRGGSRELAVAAILLGVSYWVVRPIVEELIDWWRELKQKRLLKKRQM